MSKAKRPRRPKAEPDENARNLRELALFVEDAGFRLGLASYDSPRIRDAMLARLAETVDPRRVHLTRLDFTSTPEETQLLHRLRDHLRDHPAPDGTHPAVMVFGLEATLDYRKFADPAFLASLTVLHNANIQRDAFPRLCPAPVVLWLSPTATTLFAQAAPDLWHWRSATFRFTGPQAERRELERSLVATPNIETDRLTINRKHERIAVLRDLLVDLEHSSDTDTFGGKARRAALLLDLGLVYDGLCDLEKAIEYYEAAMQLYHEIGDPRGEGNVLGNLGVVYAALGQADRAISYSEQALKMLREVGDRWGEGNILSNLGAAYAALGQADRAIDYYEQALAIAREVGDRRGEGNALGNLGNAYADLGQVEHAIGYFKQHLAIAREIGDRSGEGHAFGNLGIAYTALGQVERAIGYFEQALKILRDVGNRWGEGKALGNLGVAYAALGQVERAIGYFEQHLAIAREIGDRRSEGRALGNLGNAYTALGQAEQAMDSYERALEIGLEIKDPEIVRGTTSALDRLKKEGGDKG